MKGRRAPGYDREGLEEALRDGRTDAQALAKEFGCSSQTVRNVKAALNLPKRPRAAPPPAPVTKGEAKTIRILTEEEYEIVKDLRRNTMKNSMQILAELPDDVELQQVNYAVLCPSYEKYLEQAKSAVT